MSGTNIKYDGAIGMVSSACGLGYLTIFKWRESLWLVWPIYFSCIAWGLLCLAKDILSHPSREAHRGRLLKAYDSLMHKSRLNNIPGRVLFSLYHVPIWALCFSYPIYLYSIFAQSIVVSSEWTFSQIIAVTVWIPSIAELLYIDYSKVVYTQSMVSWSGILCGSEVHGANKAKN